MKAAERASVCFKFGGRMKGLRCAQCFCVLLCLIPEARAQSSDQEAQVSRTISAFYAAFNSHNFNNAAEFTTEDWNHINPSGGRTIGRDAVLRELKTVHERVLKGVSDTVESMSIRFATPEVAIATVISRVSTYVLPDGTKHENERQIRTFVLARRDQRWLIMQDQNTVVKRRANSQK
ncbi:MAG TPA: SgcJ/EcaC family oxidoreductase [Bryobacteraceae bacterium]|nr:SgcJ/EcaC family oxidoreductase [Bryobacteraceae bacterium]